MQGNQVLHEPIFSIFRVDFCLASATLISEKSIHYIARSAMMKTILRL